jgi:hypothetical protein
LLAAAIGLSKEQFATGSATPFKAAPIFPGEVALTTDGGVSAQAIAAPSVAAQATMHVNFKFKIILDLRLVLSRKSKVRRYSEPTLSLRGFSR